MKRIYANWRLKCGENRQLKLTVIGETGSKTPIIWQHSGIVVEVMQIGCLKMYQKWAFCVNSSIVGALQKTDRCNRMHYRATFVGDNDATCMSCAQTFKNHVQASTYKKAGLSTPMLCSATCDVLHTVVPRSLTWSSVSVGEQDRVVEKEVWRTEEPGKTDCCFTIGWHDRLWMILNGKLTMLELLNIY